MTLRWKQITTAEIDHTHEFLPPAQIYALHPFDFYSELLKKRPYLHCPAVLALKHSNPMLSDFWSETKMIKMAEFIVNLENLNPLRTIFVFDCRQIFKTDFRQIVFEWRKVSPEDKEQGFIWTARRILAKSRFSRRHLDDFCEADEKLFKIMWERQKKIYAGKLKLKQTLERK